jgi:hypothetical protein
MGEEATEVAVAAGGMTAWVVGDVGTTAAQQGTARTTPDLGTTATTKQQAAAIDESRRATGNDERRE